MCIFVYFFIQVKPVRSVKNINIKNKNINKIFIVKIGGCAAYCNNSAAKGYMMKRFPRNPERQTVWVKNINREKIGYQQTIHFFAKLIRLNFLQ